MARFWILNAVLACIIVAPVYFIARRRWAAPAEPAVRRLSRAEVRALTPADIAATPAKDGDQAAYWVKSAIIPLLFEGPSPTEDRDAPAVVVRLPDRDVVVIRTGTLRQAEAAAERYRRELRQIGPEAFCSRHALAREDVTDDAFD